jgi:hypothetical protein
MKCGWCSDGVAVDGVGVVVYRRSAAMGYWGAAAAILAEHSWIGVGAGGRMLLLLLLLLLYTKVDAGLPFHCGWLLLIMDLSLLENERRCWCLGCRSQKLTVDGEK